MMPLFGLGLAPIIVTQLLHVVDWRWIFPPRLDPGIVVAFLLYRVLRNPSPELAAEHTLTTTPRLTSGPTSFSIATCRSTWSECSAGSPPIVTSALLPNYLIDYLHLDLNQMGPSFPRSASAPASAR